MKIETPATGARRVEIMTEDPAGQDAAPGENHRRESTNMHIRVRPVVRCRRGFTLTELLIVIAILLGLLGLVAGTYMFVFSRSEVDLQRMQIQMIDREMDRFRLDLKRYPTEEEGLEALWDPTVLETEEDENRWNGPYLSTPIRADRWGTPLFYYAPSQLRQGAPYDIISAGPDREEGTEDDITNHDSSRDEDGEFTDMDFAPLN